MKTTQPTIKTGALLLLAACCMALLIHLYPEQLKAPEWVALSAVGLFALAGVCIIAQALKFLRLASWLVCGLLGAMTVVPSWIALGKGPRQCAMVSLGTHSAALEAICRGVFGAGSLTLAVIFIIAVRGALRTRHAG